MTRGTVTSFDARKKVGTVRPHRGERAVAFTARGGAGTPFRPGEAVEYTVVGGLTGVIAKNVRRIG